MANDIGDHKIKRPLAEKKSQSTLHHTGQVGKHEYSKNQNRKDAFRRGYGADPN